MNEKIYEEEDYAKLLKEFVEKNGGIFNSSMMTEFYNIYPQFRELIVKISSFINDYGNSIGLFWVYKTSPKLIVSPMYLIYQLVKQNNNKIPSSSINQLYEKFPYIRYIIRNHYGLKKFIIQFGLEYKIKFNENNIVFKEENWKNKTKNNWHKKNQIKYRGQKPPFSFPFDEFLPKCKIPPEFTYNLSECNQINEFKILTKTKEILIDRIGPPPESTDLSKSLYLSNRNTELLKFHEMLLYIEEVQMLIDISTYDLEEERIIPEYHMNKVLYKVYVAGLAEKRPSILRGDKLILKKLGQSDLYYGYAWFINLDNVLISLNERFSNMKETIATVHFTFNRTPIKLMHRALNQAKIENLIGKFIIDEFPSFDGDNYEIKANKMQGHAISAILSSLIKPIRYPLIIFGPPGTGKTMTIVESIVQLLIKNRNTKILVCTPSNSAADLICTRILEINEKFNKLKIEKIKILRVMALMRDPKLISDEIKKICPRNDNNNIALPTLEEMNTSNIIVSTATSSGYIVSLKIKKGHFSHIFIDEAGEALMGESLIPLSLQDEKTTVILAGDPKQLGPIVRSPICKQYGMEISLLERIVEMRKLDISGRREDFMKVGIFYLVDNYRAHPKIMELYSDLFYDSSLKSRAEISSVSDLLKWNSLPNPEVPIFFKHVEGKENRDLDSPSWFNIQEIDEVFNILDDLIFKQKIAKGSDIGIISPYRKQCDKIKRRLHSWKEQNNLSNYLDGLTIGTTEIFQGSERKIIIISCVRSKEENIAHDVKYQLGFVRSAKRINVAISRAKCLLIIVANAKLLVKDQILSSLIKKIVSLKAYQGPQLNFLSEIQTTNQSDNNAPYETGQSRDTEWRQDQF